MKAKGKTFAAFGALALGVAAAVAVYSAERALGDDPLPRYTDGDTISTEGLPEATLPASMLGHIVPWTVDVEGHDVRFPRELDYERLTQTAGDGSSPTTVQRITYYVAPDIGTSSWIDVSEHGKIVAQNIQPGHEVYFQPFLDAAAAPATPTPVPIVLINGREVPVPPGMTYNEVIWSNVNPGPPETAYVLALIDGGKVSRIYISPDGTLLKEEVQPEHLQAFSAFLDAASANP